MTDDLENYLMLAVKKEQREKEKAQEKERLAQWNTIEATYFIWALEGAAETPDLLRDFLDDLLTATEIKRLVNRLRIAYWLRLGAPYSRIEVQTQTDTKTIARISKKLANKKGAMRRVLHKVDPHGSQYYY